MKHSFVKGLVFTVLIAMNYAWASEIPSDPVSLGKALCESVDLGTPGYEVMREHARGARYKEALDAWRDRKVVGPINGVRPYSAAGVTSIASFHRI